MEMVLLNQMRYKHDDVVCVVCYCCLEEHAGYVRNER